MRKATGVIAGLFLGMFFLMGTAQAAEKFGYVDLTRTFSEYYKTKDYDKVLSVQEAAYTKDRDTKVNEIKQLQDKINLLPEKDKAAKKGELEAKIKAFQDYDRQKQTDLRKDQDDKMKEILKDIEDAVKVYSAAQGYTMVFNDRVLIYQDKNLEITTQIIEILNKGKKV
ncbi:MAG: OmpH family outer membrane protein [Candidatus Omnitrophota bacterium]|nr:OmpH family outer membrane protein [Candidatus Omnitrophota bacterium]